jgi:hypothetical protein
MNAVQEFHTMPGANIAKLNNAAQAFVGQMKSNVDTNSPGMVESLSKILGESINALSGK